MPPGSEPVPATWRVVAVADVVGLIRGATGGRVGRPAVVAVDGRSGAGKTTLADRLMAAAPSCAMVHTDDVAWHHSFFDWSDRLAQHVLVPVREGRAVSYRPSEWQERGREGAIAVPAGLDLLLVEGVGSGRRELTDLLDAVLWVQSDAEESRRRGIERDGGTVEVERFWEEWMSHEGPFLEQDRPWERALLLVAGTTVTDCDTVTQLAVAPGPASAGAPWTSRT